MGVATQWKPGQSGNPKGRTPRPPELVSMFKEWGPEFAEKVRKIALDDKHDQQMEALKLALAYGYGRPVQTQNIRVIRQLADLSDEELAVLAGADYEWIDEKGNDIDGDGKK